MDDMSAKNRIETLRQQINKWNAAYFNDNTTLFPESVRDQLKKELIDLETHYPQFITQDSPTQRVGVVLDSKLPKVIHTQRRYSLSDVFDAQELLDFDLRVKRFLKVDELQYSCELKIDGIHIVVRYENGVLTQALTRGDGVQGEDVTHTIRTCENIPLKLPLPLSLEIMGECFITRQDFENINRNLPVDNKFANARNLAAGSVRQLDPSVAHDRHLRMFFYDTVNTDQDINNQTDLFAFFDSMTIPYEKKFFVFSDIQSVLDFCLSWSDGLKRNDIEYDIDGIVVKVHDFSFRERLGSTAKTVKYAVAWKFPAEQKHTELLHVEFQVGRTGAITPVAVLKPVSISGSLVQKATLHTMDEVLRKDIRIGDTVLVHKAGDIIPEVIEPIVHLRSGKETNIDIPTHCPVCKSVLSTSEKVYRCENIHCEAQRKARLLYFVQTLDLEGLGEKTIIALYEKKLIQGFADFWKLDQHDLALLPGFKHKKVYNVLDVLESRKIFPLGQLLTALGIRNVGSETAEILAHFFIDTFGVLDLALLPEKVSTLSIEDILSLDGIGETVAQHVYSFFNDPLTHILFSELSAVGIRFESVVVADEKQTPLSGKKIVLTGTFQSMSRDELKQQIQKMGGKVLSAVSSQVDFVFAGDKAGSKKKKAEEISIPVLEESDVLSLFGKTRVNDNTQQNSQMSFL